MNEPQVLIAVITVVGGGLFTLLLKFIDKKAEGAKEAVAQQISGVEVANKTLEGMQILVTNLQAELNRERIKNQDLEQDLIEEKSLSLATMNELEKTRKNIDALLLRLEKEEKMQRRALPKGDG